MIGEFQSPSKLCIIEGMDAGQWKVFSSISAMKLVILEPTTT